MINALEARKLSGQSNGWDESLKVLKYERGLLEFIIERNCKQGKTTAETSLFSDGQGFSYGNVPYSDCKIIAQLLKSELEAKGYKVKIINRWFMQYVTIKVSWK
jgi:hypothetical protein